MKIWDIIKTSNRNLFRSKLRTFLTVMAIFVGSFTLTLTNGIGDGLRNYIETQVKNIEGDSVLFVRKKFPSEEEEAAKPGTPTVYKETTEDSEGNLIDPNSMLFTLEQIQGVAKGLPGIKAITPNYPTRGEYISLANGKKYQVQLGMMSTGLVQKLEAGKMFDGVNQVILPIDTARTLDSNIQNLIGKTLIVGFKVGVEQKIATKELKISGVATKGMIANINTFVDKTTAREIYELQNGGSPSFNKFQGFTFLLDSSDEKKIEELKAGLDKRGFDAYSFADIEKRTYDAISIVQIGLNLFAFIALLAASFGIINTLVIAVMERTKEIGLQKALGMSQGKVFLLFTVESILIGFWGAAIGIVGAAIVGFSVNAYLERTYLESFEGYSLFVFTPVAIFLIMLLVCAIAFLAGVLPAFRASRLNPIEALRYE